MDPLPRVPQCSALAGLASATTSLSDLGHVWPSLLLHQHEEVRRLFAEVKTAGPADRAEAFDRLRRLLAVHETAEEHAAKQLLVELENRIAVEDHAKHEEQEKFPYLRSAHSESRLNAMAKAAKAAEALAPTHPHPGVESLDRAYDLISQARPQRQRPLTVRATAGTCRRFAFRPAI